VKESNTISKDIIELLSGISHIKFSDGKNIIQKTTYKEICFWWFIRFNLFHCIKSAISTDKITQPIYLRFDLRIFNLMCMFYDVLMCLIGRIFGASYINQSSSKQKKVLITDYNIRWGKVTTLSNRKMVKENMALHPILRRLFNDQRYNVTTCGQIGPNYAGIKVLLEKRIFRAFFVHRAFESYWSWKIWWKRNKAQKYFSNIWKELRVDEQFAKMWMYKGRDLFPIIEKELEYYFICRFSRIAQYIGQAEKIIDVEKPDLVLIECEYGGLPSALTIAAKQKSVPVLSIQHGNIAPFHEAYTFNPGDISVDGSVYSPYYPIPDVTAVYGPIEKDYLTKTSDYPEKCIVVTGNAGYDFISLLDPESKRKEIFIRYKLMCGKKLVVWTTQTHALSQVENERNIKEVFKTLAALKDSFQLLIKLHPGEKDGAIYESYAKKYKVKVTIVKDSNSFELIAVADLVITRYSTTGTEAVVLNKPLIILNLSGEKDLASYVDEGVALGVYNENGLIVAVESVFCDKEVIKRLKSNREKFVQDHCYKLDGRSTERIVALIDEVTNK